MAPKRSNDESNGKEDKSKKQEDKQEQQEEQQGSSDRVIGVLSAEGYTGSSVIELLLSDGKYKGKFSKVIGLVYGEPHSSDVKDIHSEYNVETLNAEDMDEDKLKEAGIDTALIIPPARKDKYDLVKKFLEVAKKAKCVQNVVLLSSAGCDYAGENQPRLREFIDLEILAMQPKSDPSTGDTAHSPAIVRAGFFLENLLLYSKQAQGEGKLPLPIDKDHKFAPVALGDVAQLLAYIITSSGEQGLGDEVRGQMITLTGPLMTAGPELAEAASQALSSKLEFQSIKESEAKKVLQSEHGEELDAAEREYLLEYYSLVREGKTNYIAGRAAFKQLLGTDLEEPTDFFSAYQDSFQRKKRRTNKSSGKGTHKTVKKAEKEEVEE